MKSIAVIGAGAWGTALAQAYANAGRDVLLWGRNMDVIDSINTHHENIVYLPGYELTGSLKATTDLAEAAKRDLILLVTPAQYMRATLMELKKDISAETVIVICSKGIELNSGKLLSEVSKEVLPDNPVAILTGPTFASEVAAGLPCAMTLGVEDLEMGRTLQETLGLKYLRPYLNPDLIGTQLGGALKNVVAIASGIVYGKQLGENARAALLTRGIAEIARLGEAMGAQRETLLGLCGIGDLMLTATSMQSRNFSLGAQIGEGKTMEEILKTRNAVTEGVHTAKAALELAKQHNVEMPITQAVYKCLHEGLSVETVMDELLSRPLKDPEEA